ncbi:MAG: sulfatase-like hydrolase/transferase [Planctomycetota bacterium]
MLSLALLLSCFAFQQDPASTQEPASTTQPASEQRPNIIFIMADDLGREWIPLYGGSEAEMPHLDRLAESGMTFKNAYATPLCIPSRISLLTGQYPYRHGWINHWEVNQWGNGFHFDPEEYLTLANLLRDSGYATAIAGKWQVNDLRVQPNILDDHGFEEWCVWPGYQPDTPPSANRYWNPYLQTASGSNIYKGEFSTDIFVDFLLEFMDRNRDRPNFLYFPMCLPHFPFTSTPHDRESVSRMDRHRAMVQYVDHALGRIVQGLEEDGHLENSIIIFTTDNGSPNLLNARVSDYKIKGGKGRLRDSGCGAALVVSGQGRVTANSQTEELVDFTDFLPTLLELAGTALPEQSIVDGQSFAGLLTGDQDFQGRDWIMAMGSGRNARYVDGKVVPFRTYENRCLRDHRFKLWIEEGEPTRLFDLQEDPLEKTNLIGSEEEHHMAAREKLIKIASTFPAKDSAPRYTPTPEQEWDLKDREIPKD